MPVPVRVKKIPSMSVVVQKEDEAGGVVDYYQSHLHEHHEHQHTANMPPPQQYQEHNMHPLAPPTKKCKYNPYHYETSLRHPDEPSQQYSYAPNAGTPPIFYAPETVRSSPYLAMPQSTPPAHATPPPPPPQQKSVKPSSSDQPDSVTGSTNPYSTSRGLRHFSMKVCEKVEEKGTTTYNEVADELVRELKLAEEAIEAKALESGKPVEKSNKKVITCEKAKKNHDDKNIRRRVYDALNVLMAMEIITKNKKEITWRGLPVSIDQATRGVHGSGNGEAKTGADGLSRSQRVQQLRMEVKKRKKSIQKKMECLQELLVQNVCFQNLLRRNYQKEVDESRQSRSNFNATADAIYAETIEEKEKIPLPFIIVNTDSKAIVQCEMCPSRIDVSLEFSLPFEINDDNEILKRLGMNRTTKETLQRSLPPDIYRYCCNKGLLESVAFSPDS